jgi:hypothetical protein
MDSLPIWAIWSTIPGVVVLAPVLAFLLATATVIIIGLLKEVAVPAVLAFTAAGISGWLLARKARARSRSLSVVTAVESGSLGGMTRAAVGNVTPFSRISPTAASCPLGDQTGKSGGRVRQGSIPPINGVLTAPGTVWPQPVRRGT